MKYYYLLFGLLLSFSFRLSAQDTSGSESDTSSFYNMSLEELMNVEVTVASHKALTQRESPGILTTITEEEIRRSGASDLMELLKHVPGFDFGVDVEGVVGLGVRGNWAHEGKVLIILDGHELNEELYSTVQFGSHYPVDQIKQIEIIRGPGSASYGGNAEYAVINIISKSSGELNGTNAVASYGQMSKTFSSRYLSVLTGKALGKVHLNLSAFLCDANRSQEAYTDNTGVTYGMKDQSPISTGQYRLDLNTKQFRFSGVIDKYHLQQRDGYNNTLQHLYATDFNSYYLKSEYDFKVGQKITITPGVKYKYHLPWNYESKTDTLEFTNYNVSVDKKEITLTAAYAPKKTMNFLFGADAYQLDAIHHDQDVFFVNGAPQFKSQNFDAYTQWLLTYRTTNLILGARYNYSDRFDASFVPRIGITRVSERWHFKALYSSAFRSPSVENINSSSGIRPERTRVAELETGIQVSRLTYLTANIFDIVTKEAIVFYYDENNVDAYKNEGNTGTRGFELEYKIKGAKGYFTMNYSYYSSTGKSINSRYEVPGHKGILIAFPTHKASLTGNFKLNNRLNASPGISVLGKRYSLSGDEGTGYTTHVFSPGYYLDLCLNFEDLFIRGLNFSASVNNILDQKVEYIQPYNSDHAPLPGTSREFRVKLSYTLNY